MKYRNISNDIFVVIDDIIQTSLCISTNDKLGSGRYDLLLKGISQMKAYIFSEPYHIDKAIIHASRAAYLATLIEYDKSELIRFKDPSQIKEWTIENQDINKLNKLKKSNPEAFFYWYQVFLLMGIVTVQTKYGEVRMYDREKTICDIFRYRDKIGEDVAYESLKNYVGSKNADYFKLRNYAKICRVSKPSEYGESFNLCLSI